MQSLLASTSGKHIPADDSPVSREDEGAVDEGDALSAVRGRAIDQFVAERLAPDELPEVDRADAACTHAKRVWLILADLRLAVVGLQSTAECMARGHPRERLPRIPAAVAAAEADVARLDVAAVESIGCAVGGSGVCVHTLDALVRVPRPDEVGYWGDVVATVVSNHLVLLGVVQGERREVVCGCKSPLAPPASDFRLADPEVGQVAGSGGGRPGHGARVVVVHVGGAVVPQDPAVLCAAGMVSDARRLAAQPSRKLVAPGVLGARHAAHAV